MTGRSAALSVAATLPTLAPAVAIVRLTRYPGVPECVATGPRGPCAHRECRYHVAHRGYWEHEVVPTRDCALDVANEGPHTLEQVGAAFGISFERVRQIEERALGRLRKNATLRRLHGGSAR